MISKRQKQTLDYIQRQIEKNGYAPSLEEIKRHLKLSAVSTAHYHVESLQRLGYLQKEDNLPRALDVFQNKKLYEIPLLGKIAAGFPIEAIENKESIAVPKEQIKAGQEYFALRVLGESMIDENILDGDIVIVMKQSIAENGQKVIALLNKNKATLKRFYRSNGTVRLQPANPKMEPIYISADEVEIQGIVVDVIKSKFPKNRLDNIVNHVVPENKRPKGGCELVYPGKLTEDEIIKNTQPIMIKEVERVGEIQSNQNKLILGDNLRVLKNLYNDPMIKGNVKLIYIDPPFGTGQQFVGYEDHKSYSDELVKFEFLEFLRRRLVLLKELLSKDGSIYLHIDQKVGHYVKIIMDEVFGEGCFRNDITRIKCNPKNFDRKAFGNIKDVIYFYSKSKPNGNDSMIWTDYRLPLTEEEINRQFPKVDGQGRHYATTPLHAKGETKNGPTGKPWKGLNPPKGRHWRCAPEELTRLDEEGLIEWSSTNNPRKRIYAENNKGKKIQDIWDFKDPGYEVADYPTEKHEDLLKQIILSSSEEGDLVMDCFCGSGTTLVAAEKLNRNWIGIDANQPAIQTSKEKLLRINEKQRDWLKKPTSFVICEGD